jgi:hypothetical protein
MFERSAEGDFQRRWTLRLLGAGNVLGAAYSVLFEFPPMPKWGAALGAVAGIQFVASSSNRRQQKYLTGSIVVINTSYVVATQVFKMGDKRMRAPYVWTMPMIEAFLCGWMAFALSRY